MNQLTEFRTQKDDFFRAQPQSPLTPQQRHRFKGLAYFPENADLIVNAPLEAAAESGIVTMETSTGDRQTYRRAGIVRFTVDGQAAQVTLYESDPQKEFFLPFRDQTSGRTTYPAGRYLEVGRAQKGRVVIDFNRAYNPYCAYNSQWSCPIPPPENWLAVPIRAGEKDFPDRAEH